VELNVENIVRTVFGIIMVLNTCRAIVEVPWLGLTFKLELLHLELIPTAKESVPCLASEDTSNGLKRTRNFWRAR
jgi:hypothetical protein